ncbi:MAG TPA: hypothetical protein VIG42_01560 [Solirubrobacteraceae bacterium]|jgi:hypothetical protein
MRAARLVSIILASAAIAPVVALASSTPPRPSAGKWKIGSTGGFTVARNQKSISGLHLTPGPEEGCGTGTITVSGTQKLTKTSRGGYTNWIVGKGTPKTSSGVSTIKVTVHQAGQTMSGALDIVFAAGGVKRDNEGELSFGSCLLAFFANR